MYEEEKKGSFIKDLIIKLLYFFLFLFLFMWLYPAPKVDLDDVKVNVDKEALDPIYKQIFNNNIRTMKDAGKSYFTTDRLPSKTGDKVKITLKEMLNKKLLVEFTDEEGNTCNSDDSYIEVSKTNDSEYNMKVYLSCNGKKDYINEIIGCTNICPTGTCTNVITNTTGSTTSTNKSTTNSGSKTPSKSSGSNNTTTYVPVPGKNTTTTIYVPQGGNTTNDPIPSTPNNPSNPEQKYVTVYFDPQGGTSANPQKMPVGSTAYEPVSTRSGYSFICWSERANDNSCTYKYNFSSPVYNDKTLYAQWTPNKNVLYEYVKTEWVNDYTWTTLYKTGNNIKIINTKYDTEDSSNKKSYTYRTISWYRGTDYRWDYGLYINNIPSNATNVRITSGPSKFSSSNSNDMRTYMSQRYTCNIQMAGYECPVYESMIDNGDLLNHQSGSFGFNASNLYKAGNRYRIDFNLYNNNVNGSDYQYIAPIKFTVTWNEPSYNNVKKYQYAHKQTNTKYSNSDKDYNLLNNGYKLTGRTK